MKPKQQLAFTKESLDQIEAVLQKRGFIEAPGVFDPKNLTAGQYIKVPTEGGSTQNGDLEIPLTVWWLQD